MFNLTEEKINSCVQRLQAGYLRTYGSSGAEYAELISSIASMALEYISRSDAAYHDVEHSILVTLAGQEILRGKQIQEGNVSRSDWFHSIVSLLCHDIGYIKGICQKDDARKRMYVTGRDDEMICLPLGATDASLTDCHVDRGKLFVDENLFGHRHIDTEQVKHNIELTRFPVPNDHEHQQTSTYSGLARAADLIGQLADPHYLNKMPGLFYEFMENGTNEKLGYRHPGDLRAGYPKFFRNVVYPYIEDALCCLEATKQGREIIASLYENVWVVESELEEQNEDSVKNKPEKIKARTKIYDLESIAPPANFFPTSKIRGEKQGLLNYSPMQICHN